MNSNTSTPGNKEKETPNTQSETRENLKRVFTLSEEDQTQSTTHGVATDKKFWRRQNEERQTTFYNTISKARCRAQGLCPVPCCRAQGLCSVLWNDRPGKGPEEERVCVRAPLNDGSTPGPDTTLPTKHTPRPKRITRKHTPRRRATGSGGGSAWVQGWGWRRAQGRLQRDTKGALG